MRRVRGSMFISPLTAIEMKDGSVVDSSHRCANTRFFFELIGVLLVQELPTTVGTFYALILR